MTTGAVRDHHFDLAYDAFGAGAAVADFMRGANPNQREGAARLLVAIHRNLWRPRSNGAADAVRQPILGDLA